MASQNEPNFALFTFTSDLDFLTDELFTEMDFLTETEMVSLVLFMSSARVLCNRYDASWISKTKSENTRKWRNGGIINPSFDGLRYHTSGHFAYCLLINSQNIRACYMFNHRIRCLYRVVPVLNVISFEVDYLD